MKLLFAHGAGLPSTSPWMGRWADALGTIVPVTRFDYPYIRRGSRRPDRMPVLVEEHRDALHDLGHPGTPVVLIGKSMGSRVGCHLSLTEPVKGLVCLGYPLCGMGNRNKLRNEVLESLTIPILFVQGTRDKLCPLDLLADVRAKMTAESSLHIVQTGDHSLHITKTHTKKTGVTQEASDAEALEAIAAFIGQL